MASAGVDALLVNKPENMFYLSGYETAGYFWFQVLSIDHEREPKFFLRAPEASNLRHTSLYQGNEGYADHHSPIEGVVADLRARGARRVGLEMNSWFITPQQYQSMRDALPQVEFIDCSDLVDALRVIKTETEIAYVRAAAKIADAAVQAGLASIGEASSDLHTNAAVVNAMILAGGEYPALWPFITNGAATERFHVTWSGAPMRNGDLVYFHVPGVVRRYLAGVGRTGAKGLPSEKLRNRYELLREAQAEGLAAMRPGITAAQAYDGFARVVVRAGLRIGQAGYAIGINFPPRWPEWGGLRLNEGCKTVLQPGMVFHTPLSIRSPGEQTPILSNTVLVTPSGVEVLTQTPEDLQVS